MSYLFEIENLNCAYNDGRTVLNVKELHIPFGKIVFFVGESGIGKSTILETLGMMNNTMVKQTDTKVKFKSFPEADEVDMIDLWSKHNEEQLSNFRLQNFSFIFQQTNLMRNFSAYENIAVTRMLQGKSQEECIRLSKELIAKLKLDDDVDHTTQVYELSGGQQQRLAFARAIIPDFTVLFGDEPTGNLDPITAEIVMQILRTELKKSEIKTAIIVSHSFELAVEFADIIIRIESKPYDNITIKKKKKKFGFIDENSVYTKTEIDRTWSNSKGKYTSTDMIKILRDAVKKSI